VKYQGISIGESGICNYCASYQTRNYRGKEALKEAILTFQPATMEKSKEYDCIIGLSGGRDSSYLLYYLTKELNLRVVAYCVDNGYMPQQTRLNIERMVEILNVKLIVEKHGNLKKCLASLGSLVRETLRSNGGNVLHGLPI